MFFSNTFLLTISIFILTFSTLAAARPVIGQDPLSNVDTCIANCDDAPNPHQCKLNCVYGHASLDKRSPFIPGDNRNMDHDLCIELCRDAPSPYQCALDCPPSGVDVALHKRSTSPLPSASEGGPRPDSQASYCMLQCMQDLADMTMCKHRCYGIPPHHSKIDDVSKRDTIPARGSERSGRRDTADYCMTQCTETFVDLTTCEHRCYGIPPHNDGVDDVNKRAPASGSQNVKRRDADDYCILQCMEYLEDAEACEHRCYDPHSHNKDGFDDINKRSVISLSHGSEEKRQDDPSACMDRCARGPWDSQTCEKRCYNPLSLNDKIASIDKRHAAEIDSKSRINACISGCHDKPNPRQCREHCRTGGIPPDDGGIPTVDKRSVISLPSVSEVKRQDSADYCMLQCMEYLGDSEACIHRCYGISPAHSDKSSPISKRDAVSIKPNTQFNACISSCHDKPNVQQCRSDCISGGAPRDDGVLPPLHKRSVVALHRSSEEERRDNPAVCMAECMATPSDAPMCVRRCYGSPPHHHKRISTTGERSNPVANADQCNVKCDDDAPRPYHCKLHCSSAGGTPSDDGVLRRPLNKRSGISPPSGQGEEDCMDDCMRFPWDSQMCEKRCFGSAALSDSSISKRDVEEHPRYPQPYYGNYRQCVNYCEYWQGLSPGDCIKRCHPPFEHQRGTIVKRDPNSNIDPEKIDISLYQECLNSCTASGHSLKYCMTTKCPWAKRSRAEAFDGSSADASIHGPSVVGGHTKRDVRSNESDDSKACAAKCSRGPPAIREFCKQDCMTNWTGGVSFPDQDHRIKVHSKSTPHLESFSSGDDHHVKREVEGVKHVKRDSQDDCANKCALADNYEECLQNCLW
ncbi:hypothetical protein PHSY_002623 [Pseudozyma hubeiensis SY62]|uniref:Uncharacterized protein n=1 Tax=Pseudozyma hubeiensis (strain SY62) TaxID=1305764 RepID=R9P184_PSEHS|nr:hypothetical protein PHSY_002623 [Pseudozyma hubeiensis SY62]GAC95048.1 hypothetical protein PHSY_002623 [Pseudozyma hubeiensis SY62]